MESQPANVGRVRAWACCHEAAGRNCLSKELGHLSFVLVHCAGTLDFRGIEMHKRDKSNTKLTVLFETWFQSG